MLKYSNLNQQKTSRCPCILNFIILVLTFILLSIALLLCAFVSVKAQFLHLPKYKKLFASCPVCNAWLHKAALRNLGDFLQEDRFDKKTPASNTKLIKGHDFHVLISEGGYTDVSVMQPSASLGQVPTCHLSICRLTIMVLCFSNPYQLVSSA